MPVGGAISQAMASGQEWLLLGASGAVVPRTQVWEVWGAMQAMPGRPTAMCWSLGTMAVGAAGSLHNRWAVSLPCALKVILLQ